MFKPPNSLKKKIITKAAEQETPPQQSYTLEDAGVIFLNGDVDDSTCGAAIRFILEANLNPPDSRDYDHITLFINSWGGYCHSGFGLIDVIAGSYIPVHTVAIGAIASMGFMIFIAGAKKHRMLTPNTMIMSHQWSGASWGKEHELIAGQKEIDIQREIVMKHYIKHTGLPKKNIEEKLLPAHDVWLTANEAKKLGICDIVKNL